MCSALHFCTDMKRLYALAFISKAEKNMIVVFVLYERKMNHVMLGAIRRKMFIIAIIAYPVHDGCMNSNFDFYLHSCQYICEIQLRFLIIPRRKYFFLYLQIAYAGHLK